MNRARHGWTQWLALTLCACGDGTSGSAPEAGSSSRPEAKATEPDAYEFKLDTPREIVTRDNAFRIVWFPEGGVVPINEHF